MVIRMRHTRAHTANRRSHHALKGVTLAVCSNCEAKHRPHHMCLQCGFYKGRQVMDLKAKNDKRAARMQAKRDAIKAQSTSEAEEVSKTPEVAEKK
jgi:large subunit ribosomal protein L32